MRAPLPTRWELLCWDLQVTALLVIYFALFRVILILALHCCDSIHIILGGGRHVMLVGSIGTGKTTLVQSFLKDDRDDSLLSCTINASYYTDACALQRQLEQRLDKVMNGSGIQARVRVS